jgi:hypothetical protein
MNSPTPHSWPEANQRHLMAALAVVRTALERHAARGRGEAVVETAGEKSELDLQAATTALPAPSALDTLSTAFRLSPFERDVLLLCAGVELDSKFPALLASVQGNPHRTSPSFSLALAALPEAHWSALTPGAPLRRWRLIETAGGDGLMSASIRIDERVLHFLTGVNSMDARLHGLMEPLTVVADLPPSQQNVAQQISGLWAAARREADFPIVQLCGSEEAGRRALAVAAGRRSGLQVHLLRPADIPANAADRESLARLWEREAILSQAALLVDAEETDDADCARTLLPFLESLRGVVMVSRCDPVRTRTRLMIRFDVNAPSPAEQETLWQQSLGDISHQLNGQVGRVVTQFNLAPRGIEAACAELKSRTGDDATLGARLWEACRTQARSNLDALAQRIEPYATWQDLVLPAVQQQTLREISAHVRQRSKVYETWGFAGKGARGLGISALFAGSSGTGKTMAAEVLANELRLDLYRIDLSSVVSKYIGETEKNLRRVFDAAEAGGAILLFDEADALFGKRSEVKDSHDRYANIEVSYLLQRMETYRGLAILTTNLKDSIDTAFLRRIRFVVQFPFPDAAQRAEIWRRIFPAGTPVEGLDPSKLSRLNVAGGNIRNVAMNAAFLAADAGEPVRMNHLLRAARGEYAKLGKALTESETGGWT